MHHAQIYTLALCVSVFAFAGEAHSGEPLADSMINAAGRPAKTAGSNGPYLNRVPREHRAVDLQLVQGKFSGRVVDAQGKVLPGASVLLASRSKVVASAVADSGGRFSFVGQRPGVYMLSSGGSGKTLRLWDSQLAPPASARQLQLVGDSMAVIRGQCCSAGGAACGGCDSCCGGGVGGGGGYSGHFGGVFQKMLRNPWIVGVGTAAAIAIPLATDDDDDNSSGEAGASGESPDAS